MFVRVLVIFIMIIANFHHNVNALVGLDEAKNGNSLQLINDKKQKTAKQQKKKTNKNQKKQPQSGGKNFVISGEKPDNVPEWPADTEDYKMLFNDGFSNFVDSSFQTGEEFDIFIGPDSMNEINREYISGNDEEINQIEAINAEKKTIVNQDSIDKNNIATHRTRVMAYLTLDQMLFADIFDKLPHGYYINVVNKAG